MKNKTIIILLLLLAILTLGTIAISMGASVTLAWDGNCDTNVIGYTLYYGGPATSIKTNIIRAYTNDCGIFIPNKTNLYFGVYTNTLEINGRTNNMCTVSNLTAGGQYYFTITSRSRDGLESDYANEVGYLIPTNLPSGMPSAVLNFRIIKIER